MSYGGKTKVFANEWNKMCKFFNENVKGLEKCRIRGNSKYKYKTKEEAEEIGRKFEEIIESQKHSNNNTNRSSAILDNSGRRFK